MSGASMYQPPKSHLALNSALAPSIYSLLHCPQLPKKEVTAISRTHLTLQGQASGWGRKSPLSPNLQRVIIPSAAEGSTKKHLSLWFRPCLPHWRENGPLFSRAPLPALRGAGFAAGHSDNILAYFAFKRGPKDELNDWHGVSNSCSNLPAIVWFENSPLLPEPPWARQPAPSGGVCTRQGRV